MVENSWFRRHPIWSGILLLFVIIIFIAILSPKKEVSQKSTIPQTTSVWDAVRAADPPIVSDDWSTPVRLEVSEDGYWMDSLFATLDGKRIYFLFYLGDLLTAKISGTFVDDIDIYYSDYPFTTKVKETRFYASDDIYSASGQSVTENGDLYYHSNRPAFGVFDGSKDRVYKNAELLAFNTKESSFTNPQYCSGKDELWMDTNDHKIYILKNAKANGFAGTPVLAPSPINDDDNQVNDNQPWLTDDCALLYFSSTRDHKGSGPFIYMTNRLADSAWSAPKRVVKSNVGVGEPSLTSDLKQLFFVQVLHNDKNQFTSNLFFASRKTAS